MALQCSSPHLGDIGEEEPVMETNPDRFYEQEIHLEMAEPPE